MDTTSRLGLSKPVEGDAVTALRESIGDNAEVLDTAAIDDQGALPSRPVSTAPSPGIPGRYYYATDTGQLFRDHGTGWTEVVVGTDTRLGDQRVPTNASVSTAKIQDDAVTGAKLALEMLTDTTSGASSGGSNLEYTLTGLSLTPAAGTYLVILQASVQAESGASGTAHIGRVKKNGTTAFEGEGGSYQTPSRGSVVAIGFVTVDGDDTLTATMQSPALPSNVATGKANLLCLRVG